jgi:maltose O-acetyltransferase
MASARSKLQSRWWAFRLKVIETSAKSHLEIREISEGNHFNVPVRNGGAGYLLIGSGNTFGHRMAARHGNGEILLQSRDQEAMLKIGNFNQFSNNVSIIACGQIAIGDNCLIGDDVAIYDCDFHELNPATRCRSPGKILPVKIGNNVWLGSRSMILKGVTIGDNSVVGAMSVVTRSLPPNCIAAGNPAKVLRKL